MLDIQTKDRLTTMRKSLSKLEAAKIEAICTRFYYENVQRIHYRMVIHYIGHVMYRDFANYREYQKNYDMLVRAMREDAVIPNTFRTIILNDN